MSPHSFVTRTQATDKQVAVYREGTRVPSAGGTTWCAARADSCRRTGWRAAYCAGAARGASGGTGGRRATRRCRRRDGRARRRRRRAWDTQPPSRDATRSTRLRPAASALRAHLRARCRPRAPPAPYRPARSPCRYEYTYEHIRVNTITNHESLK